MISNDEIASILERFGGLLRLTGENPFRARAYLHAADTIRHLAEPSVDLAAGDRLREIAGIGEGIASVVAEIAATGSFRALDSLSARYPPSLLDLLALPGVGPKTVIRLYGEFGIADLAGVEAAVSRGVFRDAKGLGQRFEGDLQIGLAAVRARDGRIPIGRALPAARSLQAALRRLLPGRVEIAGGVRRFAETVDRLSVVVEADNVAVTTAAIASMPLVVKVAEQRDDRLRVRLQSGEESDIVLAKPSEFGVVLLRATGPASHIACLGPLPHEAGDETQVYAALGLPWIPPELRSTETDWSDLARITALIGRADLRGDLHCHSTWSDGSAPIAAMESAAAALGYDYLGITDHSRGLGVARGLDVGRLRAQRREIVGLTGGIDVLQGAEVEVHRDGRLDYDDETLASLDIVVASLHSGLRQDRATLTDRLIRTIANPHVDIIAHPSGRLIDRRPGGDIDWPRAFAAAAEHGVALEINSDPSRLDLDAEMAHDALAAGCLLSINCDAHSPESFELIEFGIAVARQAGATVDRVINAWPLEQLRHWLAERGRQPRPDLPGEV
ncbi:MAG: DNA polymerase X family [uncultured Thermomicrobiales bacterium]|uniref:DNA polymerase X family n=1 Tax=uncultured Thermomicrobiales bacterium TaxID=1645740 RepID=A0A6J4UUD0_9BACT|nr:MAG: DNA polymerase X family [uncultured Thermomicrobiales bacterium]